MTPKLQGSPKINSLKKKENLILSVNSRVILLKTLRYSII